MSSIYSRTVATDNMHVKVPAMSLSEIQSRNFGHGINVWSVVHKGRVELVFGDHITRSVRSVMYADTLFALLKKDEELGQLLVEMMATNSNRQQALLGSLDCKEYGRVLRTAMADAQKYKMVYTWFISVENYAPVVEKVR